MMNFKIRALALAALTLTALPAFADLYTDATGDLNVGTFDNIDITSVMVTNTSTDITFQINLNGSPVATNWGKYNIIMNSPGVTGGDTGSSGNPWVRPYSLAGGANKFIGGWADAATSNSQLWTYTGGAWSQDSTFTSMITSAGISYTVSLASLGLMAGDTLLFDVATSGGGNNDTAVDSLGRSSGEVSNWSDTTVLNGVSYKVTPVPEPATLTALGVGAVAVLRRRRR